MKFVYGDKLYGDPIQVFRVKSYDMPDCSKEMLAVKYEHSRAIEGVEYEIEVIPYDFGYDYEMISQVIVNNSYLPSLLKFLKQDYITFGVVGNHDHFRSSYEDHDAKLQKVYRPQETNGFDFGFCVTQYRPNIKIGRGTMTSREVADGQYIIIEQDQVPRIVDEETFFNSYTIVDPSVTLLSDVVFKFPRITRDEYANILSLMRSVGSEFYVSCDNPAILMH